MLEKINKFERNYRTNDLQIHAVIWDCPHSDAIPLIILHGLWESWHTFAAIAPQFAQKRTVYAFDLRGHGQSDKPAKGYRLQDYAADVLGILEQLPHTQVHLLGHSLGSLVAIQLAGNGYARLTRLILEDPPLVLEQQVAEVISQLEQLLVLKRQPLEVVVTALTPQYPSLERAWIEQIARDLINTADGPFLSMITGELITDDQGRAEWNTLLSKITATTLVLAAHPASGGWMGEEQRKLVREALPSAQVVDFSGCGHHIEATCTEDFVAAVEGFLDRI